MNYRFHPEAEAEFFAAMDHYEAVENGLGQAFAMATFAAIQRILLHPTAWSVFAPDIRRCLLHRFP